MPKFRSKLESNFSSKFPSLSYESQRLSYTRQHTYTPDFRVSDTAAVETKGAFMPADRSKLLTVRDQHPNFSLLLVFQNSSVRLNKKSKTTYGQWATKHGFEWCEATDTRCINKFIRKHGAQA